MFTNTKGRTSILFDLDTGYKNGTTKALLTKETVTESPPRMKSIARFR